MRKILIYSSAVLGLVVAGGVLSSLNNTEKEVSSNEPTLQTKPNENHVCDYKTIESSKDRRTEATQTYTSRDICIEASSDCEEKIILLLSGSKKLDVLEGLNLLWQQENEFSQHEPIKQKLANLRDEKDFHIAELSKFISMQMGLWPELPLESEENNPDSMAEIFPSGARQLTSSDTEASQNDRLDYSLHDHVLSDEDQLTNMDPAQKMELVESVIEKRSDHAVNLLSIAIKDSDASIRMAAVDGLGQFLEEGVGNAEEIVTFLQNGIQDENANVVKLSQQLLNMYEKIKVPPVESIDPQI